jgi:hypothetical protein
VLISIPDSSKNGRNQNDLCFDEYEEHDTGNETAEGEGEDLSRCLQGGKRVLIRLVGTVMILNEVVLTPMMTGPRARFASNHDSEPGEVVGSGWDSHPVLDERDF